MKDSQKDFERWANQLSEVVRGAKLLKLSKKYVLELLTSLFEK